jgi:cytochrome c peroxidase
MSVLLATFATVVAVAAATPAAAEEYEIHFPKGVDGSVLQIPDDNPMTAAKVELGKQLYFDARLSADGTVSCATCHDPTKGWTDQAPVSTGVGGKQGTRSAPTVLSSAFNYMQFWDGRAASLEEQALGPIENPVEMADKLDRVVPWINTVPGYVKQFEAVFGGPATADRVAKAIAAFERTIYSGNSAYDRYTQDKDENALTPAAKRGLALFEGKARCTQCHVGFDLSDRVFHNLGVGMDKPEPDLGRYVVTKQDKDKGAFKTPILRDLLKTAPYMHDGSVKTLEEVIELYDIGGEDNPWLDPKMKPLELTDAEKADLLAFLKSLEGDTPIIAPPPLPAAP